MDPCHYQCDARGSFLLFVVQRGQVLGPNVSGARLSSSICADLHHLVLRSTRGWVVEGVGRGGGDCRSLKIPFRFPLPLGGGGALCIVGSLRSGLKWLM